MNWDASNERRRVFEKSVKKVLKMYRKIKEKVFEVIQPAEDGKLTSRIFDCIIMFLIAVSIFSIFAITFDLSETMTRRLKMIEQISIFVFTVEFLLRVWTSDLLFPGNTRLKALCKYLVMGMTIIDILAILPYYLPAIIPIDLLGLRVLRLVRILRVCKLTRYSEALASIADIFKSKSKDIIVSFLVVFLLLVVASLLIYYAEHDAQPEAFQNAFSGLWWAVATLTTVGYGDIYPVTVMGRIIGAIIALLGIGMVAIPTGIISSGFMEHLRKKENANDEIIYCPHCGKMLKRGVVKSAFYPYPIIGKHEKTHREPK